MKVTAEQVAIIKKQVEQSGIINETLRDDVLDHLCCVVEIKLSKGKNFDQALQEAMHELAPEGLIELQRETVFLLNSKNNSYEKVNVFYRIAFGNDFCTGMVFRYDALAGSP